MMRDGAGQPAPVERDYCDDSGSDGYRSPGCFVYVEKERTGNEVESFQN